MRKLFCLFSLFLVWFNLLVGFIHGQTNLSFEPQSNLPVKIGIDTLLNPWAGGINFGQFSSIDFDFDTDEDLLVFDRSGNEVQLFENKIINGQRKYIHVSNGHNLFPKTLYRLTCVDYDFDGKKDLFAYSTGGIGVFRNTGNVTDGLIWDLVKPLVYTNALGTITNLFVSASDIPAYVDVDNDNDIDVLTFNLGGDRVEYHQNQSQELFGHADSLIFVLQNECWGQFRESAVNSAIELNSNVFPCGIGNIPDPKSTGGAEKHTGSTILALDMDANGVKDLILGDVSSPNLSMLINSGSVVNTNSPMNQEFTQFPSNSVSAEVNLFPAAYFEDVNFDGKKDLIVAPNARTVSENQQSVWRYSNVGSNSAPIFNFVENNFLQNEMIDNGLGSIPVLVDQNGDGLKDLIVANFFRYKPLLNKESAFLAYRNVGSLSNASFQFLNNDLFGFSDDNLGLRLVPTFGDLDSDGDQDLILGRENGTLLKLINEAGAGNPMSFGIPSLLEDHTNVTINLVSYTYPQLIDLNKDGLIDLIVGKKSGEIAYFENIGTSSNAVFELVNSNLGNVDISVTPEGYCAPHFFEVNDTLHLFVGSYNGTLAYFNQIEQHILPDSSFNLVSDNFLNMHVGLYSSFIVEDIDSDGNLDLFIGQDLGGIHHWEVNPDGSSSLFEQKEFNDFNCFPNPSTHVLNLTGTFYSDESDVQIYTILGERVEFVRNGNLLNIQNLPNGTYFLQITNEIGTSTKQFVKQ